MVKQTFSIGLKHQTFVLQLYHGRGVIFFFTDLKVYSTRRIITETCNHVDIEGLCKIMNNLILLVTSNLID